MRAKAGPHRVLIDGYNLIKPHPVLGDLPLEQGRKQLIELAGCVRWPTPVICTTVVFDAPEDSLTRAHNRVRIQFASPSADEYILHRIRHSKDPHRLIIITEDNELKAAAKVYGATRFGRAWFFQRAMLKFNQNQLKKTGNSKKRDLAKPLMKSGHLNAINEELRRIWLGESRE